MRPVSALVFSLVGGIRTGQWKRAGAVFAAALAVLAVPVLQALSAFGAPPIHDITTDTTNPPPFVAALPLRAAANATNPPEYGGAEVAAQQHRAFPDIQPLVMTLPPHLAFDRVLAEVREVGWNVRPPSRPRDASRPWTRPCSSASRTTS